MNSETRRLTVAITGASGLIGRALQTHLSALGHHVLILVRREPRAPNELRWNPDQGITAPDQLAGVAAVVHLAGENIAGGRWTSARKAAIRASRVEGTRRLVDSFARATRRPAALLCASAVGFYGNRGDEVLTEAAGPGHGLLPQICLEWEQAAAASEQLSMRWVGLRFGVVLSAAGGMLARLAPIFRAGLGGPLGDGCQYVSWISLCDASRAIEHLLLNDEIRGPVNVVAPQPVTNAELSHTLARLLHRPSALRVPRWAARLAFGELADEALLASVRALPEQLEHSGFVFRDPDLESALRREIVPEAQSTGGSSGT